MFNRKEYKKNALNQLKNSWVDAVLLSAILLVISTFSLCGGLIVFSAVSGIISIAITGVFINRLSTGETISFNSFLDSLAKRWKPAL
uniref:hypothetical protein n=1 Tax=Treponema sp. TaxID=166 RepID=UPI00388DD402